MADRKWLYGKAVVDGVPRFLSVSRLSTADEREGGCLRKWWYEMVLGRKSPKTRASIRGDNLHAEIEKYLKTGDRSLSSLALSGMHFVHDRGDDLLIEHDLVMLPRDLPPDHGLDLSKPDQLKIAEDRAAALLARAPLTADGIPIVGRMDLIHGRGTNKGSSSIEEVRDPPGTVEVCDWKSSSSPDWIKQPKHLPGLIQMAGYGEWVFRVEPSATAVRLSHGYFIERGGPSRKVSLRVLREQIAPTWEHAAAVARRIRHAARETNPDLVDANTSACDRYGGCYHREICKARMHQALASFVGQTKADQMLGKQGEQMGLVDNLKNKQGAPAGLPDLGLGAAVAQAGPTAEQLAAEKAKLEAEEKVKREAAQLRAAADKFAPILAKLEAYAESNKDMDLGMPAFAGDGAKLYFAAKGKQQDCDPVAGTGKLAAQVVTAQQAAETLVAGLDQYLANGQIKAPAAAPPPPGAMSFGNLLPAETPAPQAPPPVEITTTSSAAPSTPAAAVPSSAGGPIETAPTEEPKADKKDKPKADKKPKPPSGTTFNVVIDGVAEIPGAVGESFHPHAEAILRELEALGEDSDLRASGICKTADGKHLVYDKDSSPYTFGRGDGAIAAMVREKALPPGFYYFDTRGNRLYEVIADALREQCRRTGGMFFWGRR